MVFKISPGPVEREALEVTEEIRQQAVADIPAADGASGAGAASVDPAQCIANAVAAGDIGRHEAVHRIVEDVLTAPLEASCPKPIRQELKDALLAMVESDPHLRALAAAIAPTETR